MADVVSQHLQCLRGRPAMPSFLCPERPRPLLQVLPLRQSLSHLGPHDLFQLFLCWHCFDLLTGLGFFSFFCPFFCLARKARLQFLPVSMWMKIPEEDETSYTARGVGSVHLISFQKSPNIHHQPNEQQAVPLTPTWKQGNQEGREQRYCKN